MATHTINFDTTVDVPAHAFWAILSQFDGLEYWNEGIERSMKSGMHPGAKRIVVTGQGEVYEQLTEIDHVNMVFAYESLHQEMAPAIQHLHHRTRLQPAEGQQTKVTDEVTFASDAPETADLEEKLTQQYRAAHRLMEQYILKTAKPVES